MDLPVNSTVEGIVWPAVPTRQAANRLGTLFQLEQSQWWPVHELQRFQFRQLNFLIRYAKQYVPYYRDALSGISVNQLFDSESWRELPVLTRDDLQRAGAALRTKGLPPEHGKVYLQRTSGSTGKPVETMQSDMNRFFWNVLTLRDMHWHRLDMSKSIAVIRHLQNLTADQKGG